MNMRQHLILLFVFLYSTHSAFAQRQKPYMTIRIECIETRLIVDTTLIPMSASFIESRRAKVVHFTLLEQKGRVKHRPKFFIVIPLIMSDHSCDFEFEKGASYTLPVVVSKLPYASVKMFNEWHYKLDCDQLPLKKN